MRLASLLAVAALAAGCNDLALYDGAWSGPPVSDPALLAGMPPDAAASLHLDLVDRVSLHATLTVAHETVTLRPIARAANDTLGALDLPDAPLRSYLLVAPFAAGDALAVISLYRDDRVDLRLIRSDALYAVYHLHR